ncbi:general transcription factor 3C polypeptide 6-like [Asterias amurensis]|uniref:general transcription factor 3C polypeptide 6-like n=1 Tax=Asterias amurensis TaxID=7602 RepID=UPI003AB1D397
MQDQNSQAEEWIEEEELVVVELSGIIDSDYLAKCRKSNLKVLGVETNEPVLQLGSYVFTGQHKNMLGTAVIFEKTSENEGQETAPSTGKQWKYKCHTDKRISMQRALVKSKHKVNESTKSSDNSEDMRPTETPQAPT